MLDPDLTGVRCVLIDVDGTLLLSGAPVPGAGDAVALLLEAGLSPRYLTNTTRFSGRVILDNLRRAGIPADPGDLLTAPAAAGRWLRQNGHRRIMPLLPEETWPDLGDLELVPPDSGRTTLIDAVLVGDLGRDWSFASLNNAFRALVSGARLVACQCNRSWQEADGLSLDAGAFVIALEYAARTEAVVVGKPSAAFYGSALPEGHSRTTTLMVGDDIEGDVLGALDAGLRAALVLTGKARPVDSDRARDAGATVLPSVADLPRALGIG
jgi:HAD superfamily hydrolase (TIGR01458 family)